jgi:hypothetical protein
MNILKKSIHVRSINNQNSEPAARTNWVARNKFRLFLVIIPLLFTISCEDYLELLPPDGLVEDEYWKKKEDVEAVLMGAYQKFAQLHDELFLYGELRGDMLEIFRAPEYQTQIIFGNIEPDNQLCEWAQFYEVINLCNFVLEYAPEVRNVDNTFTEFQMKSYQAEAIFLRSLTYFNLVRIFKDVPLVLQPTDSDGINFFPSKSADTTVLRIIKEDLKGALTTVREDYGNLEENKGRANKGAINALIAEIALWNFEYDECIQYVNNIETLDYELLLPGDYYDIFYPGNSFESIFEIQFDQSLDQGNALLPLINRNNGDYRASTYSIEILSPELAGEIIRGYASLGLITENDYIIWKYQGVEPDGQSYRGGSSNRNANWIIYRYADVMLMKAEALSQRPNPDYATALSIINEIRGRALMNPLNLPDNPVAFEDAILIERAKELSYEGKRWFDLVRMGRRNNFLRKDNLIKIIIEDVSSSQKLVLASKLTDPNGWYLPIHFDELEANANLVQNPYYQAYQRD